MPEDPCAYIMAAYGVPPSPDYIPGREVPPSPDYIPGPEGPPSPDYVPVPEEPEQAPPSPVYLPYVPEPVVSGVYTTLGDYVFQPRSSHSNVANPHLLQRRMSTPAPADLPTCNTRMNSRYLIQDDPSPYHFLQGIMSRDISALTTPPPSPLTPLSSPLPQIPSPPPNSPTHIEIPRVVLPLRRGIGARSSSISSNDKREERAKDGSVCIEFRVTVSRYSRQRVISSYWASDHKNHVQLTKTMRCSKGLQTQMVEFQRQHGPAEGPSQPDALGEAGSSS
ncbi:hypothetical protein Tco_0908537 [Tanacetum coccineum]|uniref:Uncharacterized protein n=1 Tax=Tanacetum coccineum TaxID=301880 RepID=A0ABQ5CQ90_9ASTR